MESSVVIAGMSTLAYWGSAVGYWYSKRLQILSVFSALSAFILHTWLLHHWIDVASGQNITWLNLASQVAWGVVLVCALLNLQRGRVALLSVASLLAGLSIVMVLLFPHERIEPLMMKPYVLWHLIMVLWLSCLALTTLLLVILMVLQTFWLKHKQAWTWLALLPPLQSSQKLGLLMMQMTTITLLVVVMAGFVMFQGQWHLGGDLKISLSVLACVAYTVLWQRWQHGSSSAWLLTLTALASALLLGVLVLS